MRIITSRTVGSLAAVLVLATACGGGAGAPSGTPVEPTPLPPIQTIEFTALPLALGNIVNVWPLGNLNPPGHTFPSDHIGFTHTAAGLPPSGAYEVYAPAGGYVRFIYGGDDDGIEVGPQPPGELGGERTWYFMGHILLDPGIEIGTLLTAGQRIGTNSGMAGGIDLGLVDESVTNPFIRIERYGQKMAHGVRPLSRFAPALRAQLIPLVERFGAADEDGTFIYDVVERLKGNWFHESLPYDQSAETSPANWSKHLAFVEDPIRAGDQMIATGGFTTGGETSIYPIPPSDPDFAAVGVGFGRVLFRSHMALIHWWDMGAAPNRWFLVEMTGPETLLFEMFIGSIPPTDFTAAAAVYRR